jgi:hypothetical protein
LEPDVTALSSLELGDHGLLDAESRGELTLRQPAGVAQGNELLFDLHRLKFRLDRGGELRVILGALVEVSDGAGGLLDGPKTILQMGQLSNGSVGVGH